MELCRRDLKLILKILNVMKNIKIFKIYFISLNLIKYILLFKILRYLILLNLR